MGYGSVTDLWLANQTAGTSTTAEGNQEANSVSQCFIDVKKGDTVKAGYYNGTVTKFGMSPSIGHGTLYYYVGDTIQDASLINAGAVLGQLATKTNFVEAAAASMPSGRYINLTLGASGSPYTAPANGWFIISGKSTANGGYCILDTSIYEPSYMTTNDAGWFDRGFIPVRKGQVITLRYGNYEIEADRFKFIYAKGEQ